MYTKEVVQEKLATNVAWMEKALIVLYGFQTEDEKEEGGTKWENGMGFNGTDSRYLSWCAQWVLSGRHLSGHHVEKVGKRLPKYWRQILNLIEAKEGQK